MGKVNDVSEIKASYSNYPYLSVIFGGHSAER